jgi:hypothetical protein
LLKPADRIGFAYCAIVRIQKGNGAWMKKGCGILYRLPDEFMAETKHEKDEERSKQAAAIAAVG